MTNIEEPHAKQDLRRRAESRLRRHRPALRVATDEPAQVLHELQVHQAELELQNEELQRLQDDLAAVLDRYRAAYDDSPVGQIILGADTTILEANRTACALLGVAAGAAQGRALAGWLSPADADALYLHRRRAMATRRDACRIRVTRPDGVASDVHFESTAVRQPDGGTICRSILLDETPLRRAQASLHDSEMRFRDFAAQVRDVLYVVEADGHVSYVSPAYAQVWGAHPSAAVDRPWPPALDERDATRVAEALGRADGDGELDEQYRIRRADGEVRWIRDRASPVVDEAGKVVHRVGVARDCTAERARDDQLRQSAKMEAVGSLAAGIAHDFRNLLHGIAGCIQVALRTDALPTRARDNLAQVAAAVHRGTALTDQLMVFSRPDDAQPQPVVLDAVLDEAAPLLMRLVGEHIEVRLDLQAAGASVLGDAVKLEQILLNLASNAADAMPRGGTLTIATETVDLSGPDGTTIPGVRLRVADTGVGMDEATRRRVFEPFFTTKREGRGTGLGLATVLGIVRGMGATVLVESSPGRGTELVLDVPRCRDFVPDDPTGPLDIAALSGTVLLVEDDPLVRRAIADSLAQLGLRVVEASCGEAALDPGLVPDVLDLVVTDVMMPGMVGPRLVDELRTRHPRLRVLYVSGHEAGELAARGTLASGEAMLRKPFGPAALGRALVDLLQATRPPATVEDRTPGRTILLVEDEHASRAAMAELLTDEGFVVSAHATPQAALDAAADAEFDLVLADLDLPQMSGPQLVERLRADPASPSCTCPARSRPPTTSTGSSCSSRWRSTTSSPRSTGRSRRRAGDAGYAGDMPRQPGRWPAEDLPRVRPPPGRRGDRQHLAQSRRVAAAAGRSPPPPSMTSRRRDELGRLAGFCMARPWVEPRGAVPTARMSGRQLVLASREIVGGAG